jgi:phenylalanyl-tRNA synthetase beta subunit
MPHAMWNAADVPATVVEILSPAGLEAYFEELTLILPHEVAPARWSTTSRRGRITNQDDWIEELERAYGVKL